MSNQNPAALQAAATVRWNGTAMEITASYGFRIIYDASAEAVGRVYMVLDDAAGDIDPSSFITATIVHPSSDSPQTDYVELLSVFVRGPFTLPINSRGKRVLAVSCVKGGESGPEFFRIPFTITVQDSLDANPPAPYVPTSGEASYGDALPVTRPLLVWSWQTPTKPGWKASERMRMLALGHVQAEAAGFDCVYYTDSQGREELDGLSWPWEVKALPRNPYPSWFWSASKMVALEHANQGEPDGRPVVHIDIDALVKGELDGIDRPLCADHEERIIPVQRIFYPVERLREALGSAKPDWFETWAEHDRVSVCALVGGSSRRAIADYLAEVKLVSSVIDNAGKGEIPFTWFCEQAVHYAVALTRYGGSGYALDSDCKGRNFAHWPGGAKRFLPALLLERRNRLPIELRERLSQKFGPLIVVAGET